MNNKKKNARYNVSYVIFKNSTKKRLIRIPVHSMNNAVTNKVSIEKWLYCWM
jgi:hypothetical protein